MTNGLQEALRLLRALRTDAEAAPASRYQEGFLDALSALEGAIEDEAWQEGEDVV